MTKPINTASIEKATNKSWEQWVKELDESGAQKLTHTELARKLYDLLDGSVDNYGGVILLVAVNSLQLLKVVEKKPGWFFRIPLSRLSLKRRSGGRFGDRLPIRLVLIENATFKIIAFNGYRLLALFTIHL